MPFSLREEPNNKVLFIIPELSLIYPNNADDAENIDILHPPLGVLYLSSFCQSNGYETYILDQIANKPCGDDDLKTIILENHINIVGISCTMSANYKTATRYAQVCHSIGCITVLGGAHVSASIKDSAMSPYVDIVIYGEGERTWVEVLQKINSGVAINGTHGIAYKNESDVIIERKRELIDNLDSIPFPDYEKINMKKYVALESLGIITSRGCVNQCSFCTSHCTWDRKVRFRSPENIMEEIDWLVNKYNYAEKEFLFYDDNFTLSKKRVMNLCNLIRQKDYKIKWKCMSRVTGIDLEMLVAMKKAGCTSISFGFESGVEKSLKLMNKNIAISDIEHAINICDQAGIKVHGYFIIGFPWETKQDFDATIDFIMAHPQINPALNFLTPYPGTTYYEEPNKWGVKIDKNWDRFTNLSNVMHSSNYSVQDLFDSYARYLLYMEGRKNEN